MPPPPLPAHTPNNARARGHADYSDPPFPTGFGADHTLALPGINPRTAFPSGLLSPEGLVCQEAEGPPALGCRPRPLSLSRLCSSPPALRPAGGLASPSHSLPPHPRPAHRPPPSLSRTARHLQTCLCLPHVTHSPLSAGRSPSGSRGPRQRLPLCSKPCSSFASPWD